MWRRRFSRCSFFRAFSFNSRAKTLSTIAFFGFAFLLVGLVLTVIVLLAVAKDLPKPDRVVRVEGFSTKILDRNGEVLYNIFADQRRTPISISEIPNYLKYATIAVEDKNFYTHKGFDPTGILRAAYNIFIYHKLQGGSTLTQQLVKNTLLTTQRTLPRKIKEFILAIQIESRYSKDQILQMYLNESPYGGTAWGVEAASEVYFGKKASELNLVESAILAGLPQRPSYYSPFGEDPKAYVPRAFHVLRRMREDGYITIEQEKEADDQLDKVEFQKPGASFKAPHFVMYVKSLLESRYGQNVVERGGLTVQTTLDLNTQEEVQKIVSEEIGKSENLGISNGAAVVIDPQNGQILAMIGSKDYNDPDYDGEVNVTTALRQPGSAIKPVTYVTALKNGYTASTMIMDTPVVFPVVNQPDYVPANYDGKFHGPMQIRQALGNSINITAVKMMAIVGINDMLSTAYDMGISSLEPSEENLRRLGLSVTLGGGEVRLLELTNAYSAFANGGLRNDSVSILKVTDQQGKVLEEYKQMDGRRVLAKEQSFIISDILSDNSARMMTFGERNSLVISGRQVAVKTGTTNDRRDNWTVGWTPQVIVGVWVGNNDNSPMKQFASGVAGAAPIWRKAILYALKDKPVTNFEIPENIVKAEVDTVSGYLAHDGFPSRMEYFVKGTEPSTDDPIHQKLKLCKGQNKLATITQVASGNYDEKEYFTFKENDLVSTDGKNRWQEGINEWLSQQADWRYHPPAEYCGGSNDILVRILEPGHEVQVNTNDVRLRAEITSNNEIEKVEFFINDALRDTIERPPYERVYRLDNGMYRLKAKAIDKGGSQATAEVKIGVNMPWNYVSPTPSLLPTSTIAPTPSPTIGLSVTPTLP